MIKYILYIIMSMPNGTTSYSYKAFSSITECFEQREMIVERLGRPIINYQAICIVSNRGEK